MNNLHPTELEKFLIKDTIEDHEISTQVLLQRLDSVGRVSDEVNELKENMQKIYDEWKWCLEKEDQAQKAKDADKKSP